MPRPALQQHFQFGAVVNRAPVFLNRSHGGFTVDQLGEPLADTMWPCLLGTCTHLCSGTAVGTSAQRASQFQPPGRATSRMKRVAGAQRGAVRLSHRGRPEPPKCRLPGTSRGPSGDEDSLLRPMSAPSPEAQPVSEPCPVPRLLAGPRPMVTPGVLAPGHPVPPAHQSASRLGSGCGGGLEKPPPS